MTDAMATVKAARAPRAYTTRGLIDSMVTDFIEQHGDRNGGDDAAIIGGTGWLGNRGVTVIATNKGETLEERLQTNFGGPSPSGYRKAERLMRQAAKFNRPIITLINTPGAYPGREAEEGGQGEAIAHTLLTATQLPVPLIAVIIGEGGSGGALAFALGDRVWMSDQSMYSILSPEGFASILWKDSKRSAEAAAVMDLTPQDLLAKGVVERIIPDTGMQFGYDLRAALMPELDVLCAKEPAELIAQRRLRFRKF